MKYLLALILATLPFTSATFASDEPNDGDLSRAEVKLCKKNGCLGQGVSANMTITSVGPEQISTDKAKNKILSIPVVAKGEGFELEYSILQWVGNGHELEKAKLENARAFAAKLSEAMKSGKPVNLVVQGSANQMTAEFPLLGYFTNDGEFFFLERIVAPLLDLR